MDAVSFREAGPDDAAALGRLHVASWRETYAGILPDDLLEALSAESRSAMWRAALEDPAAFRGTTVFVAESGGGMVGFAACGGQRDQELCNQGYESEIGAIYVLRSHQRAGIGEALMRLIARKLPDQGRHGAALWVIRENAPARRFYERLGGSIAGERTFEELGATVDEVAYGWRDLSALAR